METSKPLKKFWNCKAFTLLELLISSSLAAILMTTVISVFFTMVNMNNRSQFREVLLTEAENTMKVIVDEIRANTLDWPEYYNYYVLNGEGENFSNAPGEDTFGSNYTVYGARFYNPGRDAHDLPAQGINYSGIEDDDLGTWCQTSATEVAPITSADCNGLPSLELTEDFATGTNPYESSFFTLPTQASAVCDLTSEMFAHVSGARRAECAGMSDMEKHEVSILFLISPDGNTKTMIGKEPWYENETDAEPAGYALSMLKMVGSDTDNDGVNETWECAPGYLCTQDAPVTFTPATDPDVDDLTDISLATGTEPSIYYDFVPISSSNISATDLRFYIYPLEDPHKAYNEFPEKFQPSVTVYMTVETLDLKSRTFSEQSARAEMSEDVVIEFTGEIQSYVPR